MNIRKILMAATVAAGAFAATSASATTMGIVVTPLGSVSVSSGSLITAGTISKTLPALNIVTNVTGSPAGTGVVLTSPVTYSYLTLPTVNGPLGTALTVSVGNQVYTFTTVANSSVVATGTTTTGTINNNYFGTVTTDPTGNFLGQTVALSEACTQVNSSSPIGCVDTISTPNTLLVPEPMSLVLLGSGLFAAGAFGRRKAKKA